MKSYLITAGWDCPCCKDKIVPQAILLAQSLSQAEEFGKKFLKKFGGCGCFFREAIELSSEEVEAYGEGNSDIVFI